LPSFDFIDGYVAKAFLFYCCIRYLYVLLASLTLVECECLQACYTCTREKN
jgi:hypothetical protein